MSNIEPLRMQPMQTRPNPGRKIAVYLKDGKIIECSTTMVRVKEEQSD